MSSFELDATPVTVGRRIVRQKLPRSLGRVGEPITRGDASPSFERHHRRAHRA